MCKIAKRKIDRIEIGSKVFWKPTLSDEHIALMLRNWGVGSLEVVHIHCNKYFNARTPNGGIVTVSLLEDVELVK